MPPVVAESGVAADAVLAVAAAARGAGEASRSVDAVAAVAVDSNMSAVGHACAAIGRLQHCADFLRPLRADDRGVLAEQTAKDIGRQRIIR